LGDATRSIQPRLKAMRLILNIVWLVLAGFWLAVGYALAGLVMTILIITIPFGLQAFKLSSYALWPFGRTVVRSGNARAGSVVGNIIWIVLAGWWLALSHLVTGVLLAITIIGLPLAIANFKMITISLAPFGREIVPAPRTTHADASV
jgi:uncharacterized membrane protein YccF (DUF307 family)